MKLIYLVILVLFAAVLLYAAQDLPPRGAASAPLHRKTSPAGTPGAGAYFIANAKKDAATPNMVTVVLADYRSIDTLGETLVVFTAGIACYFILRNRRRHDGSAV